MKYCTLIILCLCHQTLFAQTQQDFINKLGEVYSAADKKKAATIARELYNMVEKKSDLQTYGNYYLLKSIFVTPVEDTAMARICEEKADRIMNASVGLNNEMKVDSSSPSMGWATYYFPGLFKNADPQHPYKALAYMNRFPELVNFTNCTYIGYAFERLNDFANAKKNYERAITLTGNEKEVYHSWMFYANFLTRTGDYLEADKYIRRMEELSEQANEFFRMGYKSEAMSARVVYYLNIGDYQSYVQASNKNYDYFSATWKQSDKTGCDPYPGIRFTNAAFGKEMLRDYNAAEKLWKSRDSVNTIWVTCHNKTYPNAQYNPISMYPVFLMKRGRFSSLPKPASFYIKETEAHYDSYSQYADISAYFSKATHLGFLGSSNYPELFRPILDQVRATRNFRESTEPFSYYAWFSMRDRQWDNAWNLYRELFALNGSWITDIVFSFGEKAFVTYYNSKLKSGYENFHSFVKISKEKNLPVYRELTGQAFSNLLFTKSIALQGTKRRKEAFLRSNDASIHKMYDTWIDKKQQLIRHYMKAADPGTIDTNAARMAPELVKQLQDEVTTLENELTTKSRDFKKYLALDPPNWKEVRDQLEPGEAAIEVSRFTWRDKVYYSDTSYYAAYIITKNSEYPEVIYLADDASLLDDRYYRQYKQYITLRTEDRLSYDRYWKPIAEKLNGIKKVRFSPDGIFHLLNVSTLKNPVTGKYVLDEIELTFTAGMYQKDPTGKEDISTAVLVGRPSYKTNARPGGTVPVDQERSFVPAFRDRNIPDLPGTETEVLAIGKEMTGKNVRNTTLLKDQATEDKMYALKSPGILHIATHGYWSPAGENATEGYRVFNAMVNSGLLLAGVVNYYNAPDHADTYDGILTAYEAQNLDLQHTSLVILSACETNLGYLDAGEGVYGLQRAFRAAGAKSIITSLWKVDDNATKDFMIEFYKQFLETKNKTVAFRHAQQVIRDRYTHPYFWGAFIMTGD